MEFLEVLTEGLEKVLMVRGGGREVITIYSWISTINIPIYIELSMQAFALYCALYKVLCDLFVFRTLLIIFFDDTYCWSFYITSHNPLQAMPGLILFCNSFIFILYYIFLTVTEMIDVCMLELNFVTFDA